MNAEKKILQGAGELFMRYGVRSISMDDIARHLTMSKKTLYQFFRDKDEIVRLATKAHMELERNEYSEVKENSKNVVEEMVGVNQCIRKDFRSINPSLLFDLKKYHREAWQEWIDFKNIFIRESIADSLKRGIEEGYFRKEINPDMLARMRVEQVQMAFDADIFPREDYNLTDIQLAFFDHFVHGILTDKGKKLYEEYLQKNQLTEIKL